MSYFFGELFCRSFTAGSNATSDASAPADDDVVAMATS